MHAPVVLQHYLLSIYRLNNKLPLNYEMINISLFIRQHWSARRINAYLKDYFQGESSYNFLKTIMNKKSIKDKQYFLRDSYQHDRKKFRIVCEEIFNRLATHPALISNFNISEDFYNNKEWISFSGICDMENSPGAHSMLLIGA
jgi:hypothetical protein